MAARLRSPRRRLDRAFKLRSDIVEALGWEDSAALTIAAQQAGSIDIDHEILQRTGLGFLVNDASVWTSTSAETQRLIQRVAQKWKDQHHQRHRADLETERRAVAPSAPDRPLGSL